MILKNEKGIALVTALLLMLISLAIIMALLYMVTQGTQLSASQKRYRNTLAASYGGVEVFTKELIPQIFNGYSTNKLTKDFETIDLALVGNACFKQKLTKNTKDWGTVCTADSKDYDPKKSPDAYFKLKGFNESGYKVYTKIVDTREGNSDSSGMELLDTGVGVTGTGAGIPPKHIPAMYRIEVQGERDSATPEKASLSVLYAY